MRGAGVDQFYVELDCLDDLGENRLPAIRDSLLAANASVKEAADWITRTFDTQGDSTSDDVPFNTSAPYGHYLFFQAGNECYLAMRFMRQVFADNAENVDLAAQAVREIAHRYRVADGRA